VEDWGRLAAPEDLIFPALSGDFVGQQCRKRKILGGYSPSTPPAWQAAAKVLPEIYRMAPLQEQWLLQRLGGDLALDFTNTATYHAGHVDHDFLASYGYLLAWALEAGLIEADEAHRLAQESAHDPDQATQALDYARELRHMLQRLFSAVTENGLHDHDALVAFNRLIAVWMPRRQLDLVGDRYRWSWTHATEDLEYILGAVVLAAAELLASPSSAKIRRCPGCSWLFVDTSRNQRRRWCSMAFCGSKAKSQRQYQRKLANRQRDQ
jgi:predicted RNA-binding Zn ribbon-like protein